MLRMGVMLPTVPVPVDGDLHAFAAAAIAAVLAVFVGLILRMRRTARTRTTRRRCPHDGRMATIVYRPGTPGRPPAVMRCSQLGPSRVLCHQECVRAA
jgi:hypothetical protein